MILKRDVGLILCLTLLAFPAIAEKYPEWRPAGVQPRWYAQVQGSLHYIGSQDAEQISDTVSSKYEIDDDFGFGGTASLGYRPGGTRDDKTKNMRFEIEGGYRKTDTDADFNVIIGDNERNAKDGVTIKSTNLMANAYYDMREEGNFYPYIGAGVGAAQVKVTLDRRGGIDVDETVFAYQGMVGVSYALDESKSNTLFAGYRYFGTDNIEVSEFNGIEIDASVHEINAGYRFEF